MLTVEAGAYPSLDPTLETDVPPGVEVIRTKALDPFGLYGAITGTSRKEAVAVGSVADTDSWGKKLGLWARANVFLPDARVGWVPFAVRAARERLARGDVGAMLTSGPPHSAHLVGLRLRRQRQALGIQWIADFRDPWTGITFYDELPMTPLARRLDHALERRVLREADRVITVSPTWGRDLEEQGGLGSDSVEIIQNGFDPADFADVDEPVRTDAFEIAHVGSLYGPRNPEGLWRAIADLRARGEVPKLRVRLVGRVDGVVEASLAAHGLTEIVDRTPVVPHDEAVRAMARAGLLVLSIEPVRKDEGILTGKLYEYLASTRPVLALGPVGADADRLLRETGGGTLVARDDARGAAEVVREHYRAWEAGSPLAGAAPEALGTLSRRAQAGEVAALVRDGAR
ncbi:glycosyltransferase [Rubricoccus marinus]|uniref:glycosyltransferase n=1 Tax=Rubricoccus marinus TaxID=716817 RepID=UPI001FEBD26D